MPWRFVGCAAANMELDTSECEEEEALKNKRQTN